MDNNKISSDTLREQINNGLNKVNDTKSKVEENIEIKLDEPIEMDPTLQENPYENMSVEEIASNFLSEEDLKFVNAPVQDSGYLDIINETAEFVYDTPNNSRKFENAQTDEIAVFDENQESEDNEIIPEYEPLSSVDNDSSFVNSEEDDEEVIEARKENVFSRFKNLKGVKTIKNLFAHLSEETDSCEQIAQQLENNDEEYEEDIDSQEIDETEETSDQLVEEQPVEDIPAEDTNNAEEPQDNIEKSEDEIDNTDVKIMMAFDMEEELGNTVSEEVINEVNEEIASVEEPISENILEKIKKAGFDTFEKSKDIVNKAKDSQKRAEYTSIAQINKVFYRYKKTYNLLLLKLLAGIILLIISFLYENLPLLGGAIPESMNMAYYPVVHSMISLQFVVLASLLVLNSLLIGVKAILNKKFVPESITVVIIAATVIYDIVVCFAQAGNTLSTYSFATIFCIFITLIYNFFNVKREIFSFNIVASKREKLAIVPLDANLVDEEREAFGDMISEDAEFFKIDRTNFVEGFFDKMGENDKERKPVAGFIIISLGMALLFFIIGWIRTKSFLGGCNMGHVSMLFALPLSTFISYCYPLFRACDSAYGIDSAILGEDSIEKYSKANVISFDDSEIFPPYNIHVKHITTYGESRIDNIISIASGIYSKVGGPLKTVFETVAKDLVGEENVEIINIGTNGTEALVDGKHVYIGKEEYIRQEGVDCSIIAGESNVNEDVCVLYLAINTEIVAKIQILYNIDPDFSPLLKHLYKGGIRVGIKTSDPNINDAMLSRTIKIDKYPVKILRMNTTKEEIKAEERLNTGVVSKGTAKELLQTLSLCEVVSDTVKNSAIVKIFSVCLSLLASIIVVAFSSLNSLSSAWIVLYQFFWMIPIVLMAKFSIEKFKK